MGISPIGQNPVRSSGSLASDSQRTEVFVVSNPLAGAKSGQDDVFELNNQLRNQGFQPRELQSLDAIGNTVGESLTAGKLRAVVCVGGDGTVAAVVNRTPAETPLAILPRGTENLLAKYTQQPFDPAGVCEMIAAGHFAQLDVGRAGDKLFLLMLSAGFDADVVHRMAASRTGHITHWSWAKPIWDSLRSYKYPELRISWRDLGQQAKSTSTTAGGNAPEATPSDDGLRWDNQTLARWVFVLNLPCYARGLPIAPTAIGTDGQLDICAYDGRSLYAGLKLLLHTILRRHHLLPNCQMLKANQIRLESDHPIPYQVDGDPGGWLPVNIEIVPQRMRLVVPQQFVSS
jgi:diacylglycerol kinase (ATP)